MTITSISPLSGPPGTTVTITGTGFTAGSRVCCPAAVATTYISAGQVQAEIPASFQGPDGTTVLIAVFVAGADGTATNGVLFTVQMPAAKLQTYTTLEAVCSEVPGFARGGQIADGTIQLWMSSVAQVIKGAMLRRGLSLSPADWQQAGTDGTMAPAEVLELINRMGAAARLAAAVVSLFGNADAAFSKNLSAAYKDELARLEDGAYDKSFKPAAATMESGPLLAYGDTSRADGDSSAAFTKEKVF